MDPKNFGRIFTNRKQRKFQTLYLKQKNSKHFDSLKNMIQQTQDYKQPVKWFYPCKSIKVCPFQLFHAIHYGEEGFRIAMCVVPHYNLIANTFRVARVNIFVLFLQMTVLFTPDLKVQYCRVLWTITLSVSIQVILVLGYSKRL